MKEEFPFVVIRLRWGRRRGIVVRMPLISGESPRLLVLQPGGYGTDIVAAHG